MLINISIPVGAFVTMGAIQQNVKNVSLNLNQNLYKNVAFDIQFILSKQFNFVLFLSTYSYLFTNGTFWNIKFNLYWYSKMVSRRKQLIF